MMKPPSYLRFALLFILTMTFHFSFAEIKVSNNLLTATFKNVKLQDALKEIAKVTKTRIVLSQPIEDKISIGFNEVSTSQMLTSLLAQYNYVLLTHNNNQPKEVIVMSRKANAGELAQFIPPPVQNNSLQPNMPQQQTEPIRESEVTMTINGKNVRALVDEGAPTSIISFEVAKKSKVVTPDGRLPRDGDYVEIANMVINGRPIGVVPVIVVKGLPIDAIVGREVIEQAGFKKPSANQASKNSQPKKLLKTPVSNKVKTVKSAPVNTQKKQ